MKQKKFFCVCYYYTKTKTGYYTRLLSTIEYLISYNSVSSNLLCNAQYLSSEHFKICIILVILTWFHIWVVFLKSNKKKSILEFFIIFFWIDLIKIFEKNFFFSAFDVVPDFYLDYKNKYLRISKIFLVIFCCIAQKG